jgi:integrase
VIASQASRSVSGHVYQQDRKKGPVWYWKIRLPAGREERRAIGQAWTGTGRTPDGYFTRRSAEAALHARLTDLRRGIGVPTRYGETFGDAAEYWFERRGAQRQWKASTRRDYRSALNRHLIPAFGDRRLDAISTEVIEAWRTQALAEGALRRRTAAKLTTMLHSIFETARKQYGLSANPVRDVEPLRLRYNSGDYDFYGPEEVWALVRAADAGSDSARKPAGAQDAAIYLTAAFSGLRLGELLALRVRDVDFPNSVIRVMGSVDIREGIGTPKSGHGRSVPMADDVATALARLLERDHFTSPDDLVFVSESGRYLDGSALRRRYKAAQKNAELRPLRFHDLRHTFGSLAVTQCESIRELQEWMGHVDARTTQRYIHYKPRTGEAKHLSKAFKVKPARRRAKAGGPAPV